VNEVELDYIGAMPEFKYFDKLTLEEYECLCKLHSGEWSLRAESIKYCINDCVTLYQVLNKFNDLIFDRFKLNVNNCSTITRLAFDIFRAHYLKENTIPMIHGDIYDHIKMSYTGGGTDMYIPSNSENELIYGYDVNSLYPSVMEKFDMPVGNVTYFEGDIRKYQPEAFGFFYCQVKTPSNLAHLIIQTHVKTPGGLRTLSALGTFYDMIFSFEMDNAIKLGYQFDILWGYTFDRDNIFKEFVTDLYNLRLEYPKSHPMNFIAKIIMNSLYGRFGMDDRFDKITIIEKESFDQFIEKRNPETILNVLDLDTHFLVETNDNNTVLSDITRPHNISIPIASAITSYSRVFMSQFKNIPSEKMKLFYTDTDSIYTNLTPDLMNDIFASCDDTNIVDEKGLGKLKLESISDSAVLTQNKQITWLSEATFVIELRAIMALQLLLLKEY
jgi:DNA polymerase elongation subunit (family B)